MSLEIINARLDLVSQFRDNIELREKIINLLKRSYDSQRLVQKFSMGRGDADDLVGLLRTIESTNEIASILLQYTTALKATEGISGTDINSSTSLLKLCRRLSLEGPSALALCIVNAIDEEGLSRSNRMEEHENADIVSLAQKVVLDEASADEQAALPKIAKSKAANRPVNEQDADHDEVWIMRKR